MLCIIGVDFIFHAVTQADRTPVEWFTLRLNAPAGRGESGSLSPAGLVLHPLDGQQGSPQLQDTAPQFYALNAKHEGCYK